MKMECAVHEMVRYPGELVPVRLVECEGIKPGHRSPFDDLQGVRDSRRVRITGRDARKFTLHYNALDLEDASHQPRRNAACFQCPQ